MRSRLRFEELSEGLVIHLAVEGRLKAHSLQAEVEELAGIRLGAGGCVAPGLVQCGSKEFQVKGKVIGDGEWRSLIEIGHEVGRESGLAGGLADRWLDRPSLLLNPPDRG